jgi:hypothetical protein
MSTPPWGIPSWMSITVTRPSFDTLHPMLAFGCTAASLGKFASGNNT